MILFLLVFPIIFGAETLAAPVPVLTIKSPDGDLIDCINRADQPAFRNPLLKDHVLQYAIGYIQNATHIYGTRATLNVWEPLVEASDDFSLAQIWLASGSYKNEDLNTVEAGWQICPERYHDHQPRLFTFWTRDAYVTGYYSTHCDGFVQVSSRIALEAAITCTSTFGGPQVDITLHSHSQNISKV